MIAAARRPPTPHWAAEKGVCRWCGKPVLKPDGAPNPRRRWHDACVTEYRVAVFSKDMRQAVFRRDGGFCAKCGLHYQHCPPVARPIEDWNPYRDWRAELSIERKRWSPVMFVDGPATPISFVTGWHADHATPLEAAAASGLPWPEILRYWSIDNLQSLCLRCHDAKTRREARQRGERRRAARKSRATTAANSPDSDFAEQPQDEHGDQRQA